MDKCLEKQSGWMWIFAWIFLIDFGLQFEGVNSSKISDEFYANCGTPDKICYGVGPTPNCISTKTCKYAGATVQNETEYTMQFYSKTVKDDILHPCTATFTVLNDVVERTKWVNGEGWKTQYHCKESLNLTDFWPVLYINTTKSCLYNRTSWSYGEGLSSSAVLKATWKSQCEDRLRNTSSSYISSFGADGKIVTITGSASVSAGCYEQGSFGDWPKSFTEVLKAIKPLTGSFYSNIESYEDIFCTTSSTSSATFTDGRKFYSLFIINVLVHYWSEYFRF